MSWFPFCTHATPPTRSDRSSLQASDKELKIPKFWNKIHRVLYERLEVLKAILQEKQKVMKAAEEDTYENVKNKEFKTQQ